LAENSQTASDRALRAIKTCILEGKYETGEQLPSVRIMCNQMNLTRHGAWVAVRQLEQEGWLRRSGRSWVVARSQVRFPRLQDTKHRVVVLERRNWKDVDHDSIRHYVPGHNWFILMGVMQALGRNNTASNTIDPEQIDVDSFIGILNERPQGVIGFRDAYLRQANPNFLHEMKSAGIPVVVYGYDQFLDDIDTVRSDHEEGTYQLTRFLIERGRKRILRYWELDSHFESSPRWLDRRNRGYERAMDEAGIEVIPPWHSHELPFDSDCPDRFGHRVIYSAGLLSLAMAEFGQIDAIMTLSDGQVFSLAAAMRKLGMRPNEDIDIVGYDNYWEFGVYERRWEPFAPLATVDKRNRELGIEMVDLLYGRINHELPDEPEHREIKPKLVICNGEQG